MWTTFPEPRSRHRCSDAWSAASVGILTEQPLPVLAWSADLAKTRRTLPGHTWRQRDPNTKMPGRERRPGIEDFGTIASATLFLQFGQPRGREFGQVERARQGTGVGSGHNDERETDED